MECSISPQDEYKRMFELDQPTTILNLPYAAALDNSAKDGASNSFKNSLSTMPKLKTMMELREHKQFHKLFMQNQLCRNITKAITEIKSRGQSLDQIAPIPVKKSWHELEPLDVFDKDSLVKMDKYEIQGEIMAQ